MKFTINVYDQNTQCLFHRDIATNKFKDPFERPEVYWEARKTKANPDIKEIVEYMIDGVTHYEVADFHEGVSQELRAIFANPKHTIRVYPARKFKPIDDFDLN